MKKRLPKLKKVSKLDSKESDTQPKNVMLKSFANCRKALVKEEEFAMNVMDQQAGFR